MGRISGISIVLGLGAFVLYGLFTSDWQTAILIGLGLAGFGSLGMAGIGRARGGQGGTMVPGGSNQPKSDRRNEL